MSAGEPSELRRSVDLRRWRRFFSLRLGLRAVLVLDLVLLRLLLLILLRREGHLLVAFLRGLRLLRLLRGLGGAGDASVFALGGGAGRTSSLFGAGDGGASTVSVMVRRFSLSCAGSEAGTPSALSQAVSNSTVATTPKGMR